MLSPGTAKPYASRDRSHPRAPGRRVAGPPSRSGARPFAAGNRLADWGRIIRAWSLARCHPARSRLAPRAVRSQCLRPRARCTQCLAQDGWLAFPFRRGWPPKAALLDGRTVAPLFHTIDTGRPHAGSVPPQRACGIDKPGCRPPSRRRPIGAGMSWPGSDTDPKARNSGPRASSPG
jgi:hypothetical protein